MGISLFILIFIIEEQKNAIAESVRGGVFYRLE